MEGLAFSLAGIVVGIAVGATGVGGGSLMTPILILAYGISPAIAVGTDLLYASISKGFGVLLHGRNDSVDWKIVGWMALGSVPGTLLALAYVHSFGASAELDRLIKITLSAAILITATFTLFQEPLLRVAKRGGGISEALARHQRTGTVLAGLLIGTVVAISSVGAGVIGMMLLMLLYPKHSPIKLVGSDLAHAVIITGIAGLGHARLGTVNCAMLFWLLLGALPGVYLGTRVGFRLDGRWLKKIISATLILIGGMTMAKAMASL